MQAKGPIYLDAVVEERAADTEQKTDRVVRVVASTEALDSHGSILKSNWRLDRFNENPVVLWAHRRDELPIATAKAEVKDKRLVADVSFPPEGTFARSDEVYKAWQAKLLRGISVGFYPHTVTFEKNEDVEVMVMDDNELLEISFVPVQSNPETLAEARELALSEIRTTAASQAAPNENAAQAAPTKEQRMDPKVLAADLGLTEDATEAQIREAVAGLTGLLATLGVTSVDAARGAIEALRANADALKVAQERLAALEKSAEDKERDALIAKLEGEKRLTPAQRDGFAKTASLETLKAFAATAPIVMSPSQHREPPAAGTVSEKEPARWNGKTFAELTPNERHSLYREDADLYRRLRDGN